MKHRTHFTADWFTQNAAEWMRLLGHLRDKPSHGLEIGSYEGRSACWFLENLLTHDRSTLTCIDPWDGSDPCLAEETVAAEKLFDANTKPYGKVLKSKEKSKDVLPRFIEEDGQWYDFVYVDGDHEGYSVLYDLVLGWELVKPGGWIIADDYKWTSAMLKNQPASAIDLWMNLNPPGLVKREPVGRLMFFQKGAA